MARKKGTVLDVSPGSHDVFHEEPDGTYTIETRPNVELQKKILEFNKRRYNNHGSTLTPGKIGDDNNLGHHVANIPGYIYDQWYRETNGMIEHDTKILMKKLSDPDYKYLKTSPIKL